MPAQAGHDERRGHRHGNRRLPPRPEIRPGACRRSPACGSRPPRPASNIADRTDVLLALFDARHHRGRRVHQARNARRRRSNGAAPISRRGKARALVVNSGNANAFTGKTGRDACQFTAKIAASAVGCKPADIFLASTGVIGEPLNASAFDGVMDGMVAAAHDAPWLDAAKAIMTTDTFPKVATATAQARQGHRHHQRHRQGRRHDRARHGDDAVVRLHRRADRRARVAGAASGGRRPTPSTP